MIEGNAWLDKIIQNRIISHILFWCSVTVLFALLASISTGSFFSEIISHVALMPAQIGAAYLFNYYQIPELLYKKRIALFSLSMVLSIYVFTAFGRWCIIYLAEPFIRTDFTQESITQILSDVLYLVAVYFPVVYTYALIILAIKAIKSRFEERHQIEVLEK